MLLKGKKIFIVEDKAHNRLIFKMILVAQGACLEFSRWGQEAVARLHDFGSIDLIILDLNLQDGITGFDIFKEIRRCPAYDATPIIMVSATDPTTAMPMACKLGFAGFIAKPIDDELFPEQIGAIMAGQKIWNVGGYASATVTDG